MADERLKSRLRRFMALPEFEGGVALSQDYERHGDLRTASMVYGSAAILAPPSEALFKERRRLLERSMGVGKSQIDFIIVRTRLHRNFGALIELSNLVDGFISGADVAAKEFYMHLGFPNHPLVFEPAKVPTKFSRFIIDYTHAARLFKIQYYEVQQSDDYSGNIAEWELYGYFCAMKLFGHLRGKMVITLETNVASDSSDLGNVAHFFGQIIAMDQSERINLVKNPELLRGMGVVAEDARIVQY